MYTAKDFVDLLDHIAAEQVKDLALNTMQECADAKTSDIALRVRGGEWRGILRMRDAMKRALKNWEEKEDE
jgi:hypothetical protein